MWVCDWSMVEVEVSLRDLELSRWDVGRKYCELLVEAS